MRKRACTNSVARTAGTRCAWSSARVCFSVPFLPTIVVNQVTRSWITEPQPLSFTLFRGIILFRKG